MCPFFTATDKALNEGSCLISLLLPINHNRLLPSCTPGGFYLHREAGKIPPSPPLAATHHKIIILFASKFTLYRQSIEAFSYYVCHPSLLSFCLLAFALHFVCLYLCVFSSLQTVELFFLEVLSHFNPHWHFSTNSNE